MTQVQNRVLMKGTSDTATGRPGPGFERAWSTAFWFGSGARAGLAETRRAGDGYEGHLLSMVSGVATRSEPVCGSLSEVKAALLAAVEGLHVVQDKSTASREKKRP
jgi:hypothetical protein